MGITAESIASCSNKKDKYIVTSFLPLRSPFAACCSTICPPLSDRTPGSFPVGERYTALVVALCRLTLPQVRTEAMA